MKFKIIVNPKKVWAKSISDSVKELLRKNGHFVIRGKQADATICIGGDGTILYAGHKNRLHGSVLGIGSASSYICQLNADDPSWQSQFEAYLRSRKTVPVMTLKTQTTRKIRAINDFVIHSVNYRVLGMNVSIDGTKTRFDGDGIIISSSLGSAAYAYSAGGEKLSPTSRSISIAPICPYKRQFVPQILDENSTISISVIQKAALIADGILVGYLPEGSRISIKKGDDILFYEGIGRYG